MRRPRLRRYQNNHILLFDQAAILSSRPALSRAGARSGRQGWPQATAQRLVLDGREHGGTIEADRTTPSPLTPSPPEPMSPPIGPSSQPLTRPELSRIERGQFNMTLRTMCLLALALGAQCLTC